MQTFDYLFLPPKFLIMQTDSTFEFWLTSGAVAQTIRSIQPDIHRDHTSIFPPICEVQQRQRVDYYSVLAEEVRSPLSIINLSVEMLKTRPPAKDSAIYLDIIARNCHRINNMIDKLFQNQRANTQPVAKSSMLRLLGTPSSSKPIAVVLAGMK